LEGLEITIFNNKEIILDNTEYRLDAEYFQKQYLSIYANIQGSPMLGNITYMSDLSTNGSFATVAAIKNDNNPKIVPFIRSGNVGDTFIKESDLEFISKEAHLQLPKSTTQLHEIIMARKGKIGGASIVMENEVNFNCSENVIKLRILNKEEINPFYFTSFFNSKYGLKQIERLSTGNVQPWVSIFQIRKLMIPVLNINFQNVIERLILKSHQTNILSSKHYLDANTILLQEIDLHNFTPSSEGINIKTFSNSFATTGRLDAEYYQPKYDQVVEKIKTKPYETLLSIVKIKKSIEPGSINYREEGLPFMRVADFSKNGLTEPQKFLSSKFVTENKEKIDKLKPKRGTILFSKDGSVGTAYHLREDFNGITSGAILHLKVRDNTKVIPEYLTLALNSQVVQMQAERDAGGSIILHWRVGEIENVIVPIIPFEKQQQIANLVEESFSLKKQSEHLLEVAKRAVEIAIEENEEFAMDYINKNNNI
jgi:type I restriction enzyme S subunit